MRRLLVVLTLTSLFILTIAGSAFAYDPAHKGDRTAEFSALECKECHENTEKHTTGPHGGYATGTDKCSTCHDVHADAQNPQLLMGETLTDACNYCHDLTASWAGPYNMTGDFTVSSAHRVVNIVMDPYTDTEGDDNAWLMDGIVTIPGGNAADGSSATLDTTGQGKLSGAVFTCNSCHTPHGVNTVRAYLGESNVKFAATDGSNGIDSKLYLTNRLLKTRPNNVANAVYEYGSSWCAGCHQGRDNGIDVNHNHPVNENAPAYRFLELAWENGLFNNKSASMENDIATVIADGNITIGASGELVEDPRKNQQYAMNPIDEFTGIDRNTKDGYVPIADYAGTGPSCQQCHGSARDVEGVFEAVYNPVRASFPHISSNKGLLVEVKDDFCTNCHAPSILP